MKQTRARQCFVQSQKEPSHRSCHSSQQGSFLAAGALFLVVFMLAGALAVDISRKFMQDMKLQQIADGAALTGAESLNQYKKHPDHQRIYRSVFQYIRQHQGLRDARRYEPEFEKHMSGIEISTRSDPDPLVKIPCTPKFHLRENRLRLSDPARLSSEIIGSALTKGSMGEQLPITLRIHIEDRNGNDTTIEPWGSFNNPRRGNVNGVPDQTRVNLANTPRGAQVDLIARSWDNGRVHINASTDKTDGEANDGSPMVRLIKNGDELPGTSGYGGQQDPIQFVQRFVNDKNRLDLEENQVLVFFELGTKNPYSRAYDFQDLILLIRLKEPLTATNRRVASGPNKRILSTHGNRDPSFCREKIYRVGVTVQSAFQPLFVPRSFLGEFLQGNYASSVAQAKPLYRWRHERIREGEWGVLTTPPDYENPAGGHPVGDVYGVEDPMKTSCNPNHSVIRCDSMNEVVRSFGQDVELRNQVLWVDGNLNIVNEKSGDNANKDNGRGVDPSPASHIGGGDNNDEDHGNQPPGIRSITGKGFVLIRGTLVVVNPGWGSIHGELDLVSFDGHIRIRGLEGGETLKGYLVALNGDVRFDGEETQNITTLIGGVYASGTIVSEGPFVEISTDGFCPAAKNSKLCTREKVALTGARPYSWDVSLVK